MNPADRLAAVVGRTGFGKSALTRSLVRSLDRVIVLEQADRKAEYDALRFNTWPELVEALNEPTPARFRVSFSPGLTYFKHVLALAWVIAPVTLVIEEAGKYFPPGEPVPKEFLEICERGRHAGVDGTRPVSVIAVSQRPMRLPISFRAELSRVYSFRLGLSRDRNWLAESPGADQEIAVQTKDLQKYEYLNINADGGVTRERTSI